MTQNAVRFIAGLTVAMLLALAISPAQAAEAGQRLVLGRISGEPHKHIERLRTMADYLAVRLADHGVSGIDILVAESPERMRHMIERGEVDLFSETAFVALDFINDGLAKPLLREWKKGVAQYHSVVVVRKDSGIRTLADLSGHKFAFEDPGSTSGYLMPRVALEMAGLRLTQLPDPRNPVPKGTVGYSFARGEINVIAWVNRGLADAGSVSNLDWNDPETAPAELKNELRVIHETQPVIRSLFLTRTGLDAALCERIAKILVSMDESEPGRAVLKQYFKMAKFDRIDGDAQKGLEAARTIWQHVRGQTE